MNKTCLLICPLLMGIVAKASPAYDSVNREMHHPAFVKNSFLFTGFAGFENSYRRNYTVPTGFERGKASGFVPVYVRAEYAASNHISLAFTAAFNTTYFNSSLVYSTFSGPFSRISHNELKVFSGAISAAYHFTGLFRSQRFDPFLSAGVALSKVQYSALPQGDSTIFRKEHVLSPVLKAGIRYYISDQVSIYAEAGYDKLSIAGVGFSCRFFHHPKDAGERSVLIHDAN